jgi:hypothetical protein
MYSFEKFYKIEEAISLKNVRKFNLKKSNGGAYYIDQINEIFKGKDRLVYDIQINDSDLINVNNPIVSKILEFLKTYYPDYEITKKSDYVNGVCYKKKDTERKQPTKIGRLLQKHAENEEIKNLLESFKKDPTRSLKGNSYKVVISRHPYDIAGMSTDRNWRSCMTFAFKGINYPEGEVKAGVNVRYVPNDITEGSIVAYLVSPEDVLPNGKIALKRPVSRILMKPHVNMDNSKDYAYSEGRTYGADNKKFSQFIKNWLVENINKNTKDKKYLKNTALYEDGDETPNFTAIKQDDRIIDRIFFEELSYNTDPKDFNNFTLNTGEGNYGGLFLEFGINFVVPNNIKLNKFRYEAFKDPLPKYLQEILNKINLKEKGRHRRFGCSLVESFEDTNSLLIEYRYDDGYFESPTDEKGNPINDNEYLYDYWDEVIRSLNIQNVNYRKIYKDVVDVLTKSDPKREETEERESIKNDFKNFLENQPKSPTLTNNLNAYKANKAKFDNAKKYINSLGVLSVEKFRNLYKTDVFSENLKIIQDYINLFKTIKTAFMHYVPQKYSLISAYNEWTRMIGEYLNSQDLVLNIKVLSIQDFLHQLHELMDKIPKEEYNDLRDKFSDYRELSRFR